MEELLKAPDFAIPITRTEAFHVTQQDQTLAEQEHKPLQLETEFQNKTRLVCVKTVGVACFNSVSILKNK